MQGRRVMLALVVVSLLGVVPFVSAGEQSSVLLSILKASKGAIESYDVEKNMEVLHKHYFTTTKEQSIWYHLLNEMTERFDIKLSFDNLQFIERLIQKIDSHYNSCLKSRSVTRADCFSRMAAFLVSLESGLRWEFVEENGVDEGRLQFGFLYHGAAYLAAHLTLIAFKSMADVYKGKENILREKVKPFSDALHKYSVIPLSKNDPWSTSIVIWRKDQIGPANICEMKEYLWKEYQQTCETRWHSSQFAATEKGITEGDKRSKTAGAGDGDYDDFDDIAGEEEDAMNIVNKFGGVDNYTKKRFRVQVHDYVKKEVLYEKYMDAEPSSRGDVMNQLAIKALIARTKAVNNLSGDLGNVMKAIDSFTTINDVRDYLKKQA